VPVHQVNAVRQVKRAAADRCGTYKLVLLLLLLLLIMMHACAWNFPHDVWAPDPHQNGPCDAPIAPFSTFKGPQVNPLDLDTVTDVTL